MTGRNNLSVESEHEVLLMFDFVISHIVQRSRRFCL